MCIRDVRLLDSMLINIQFPPCRLLVSSCSRQYTCVPEGINTLYCIVSSYIPEDEVGGAFPVGGACSVGGAAPLTFTLTSSWSLTVVGSNFIDTFRRLVAGGACPFQMYFISSVNSLYCNSKYT